MGTRVGIRKLQTWPFAMRKEFSAGISVHDTPHYANHFSPRTMAPVRSPGKIGKGDVTVLSEQKITFLTIHSVKSFSMNVMEATSKTTGAHAKDAGDRNIREVTRIEWSVPINSI